MLGGARTGLACRGVNDNGTVLHCCKLAYSGICSMLLMAIFCVLPHLVAVWEAYRLTAKSESGRMGWGSFWVGQGERWGRTHMCPYPSPFPSVFPPLQALALGCETADTDPRSLIAAVEAFPRVSEEHLEEAFPIRRGSTSSIGTAALAGVGI